MVYNLYEMSVFRSGFSSLEVETNIVGVKYQTVDVIIVIGYKKFERV